MNTILWVDDEIDLLKPYIIYLQQKGYEVVTCNNGQDAYRVLFQYVHKDSKGLMKKEYNNVYA